MSDLKSKIKKLREDFNIHKMDLHNLPAHPIALFQNWMELAIEKEKEAIAFVLSTVSKEAIPTSRVLLLRDFNEDGFTFFTNYKSAKSKNIDSNNKVALNFFWPHSQRQIRIVGDAAKIPEKESDQYFSSRPRESQLGAWISEQSKPIDLHFDFTAEMQKISSQFEGKAVERPKHWGGYKVNPLSIEFWQGQPSRLHQRVKYSICEKEWKIERLAP